MNNEKKLISGKQIIIFIYFCIGILLIMAIYAVFIPGDPPPQSPPQKTQPQPEAKIHTPPSLPISNAPQEDLPKDAWEQFKLGQRFFEDKKFIKAIEWFQKAAKQGLADAQLKLGECCAKGIGIEKNYNAAFSWFYKAAEQGLADAQLKLGKCYAKGIGIEKNYNAAFNWFYKAAEQGNVTAQYALCVCYKNGLGVNKDLKKATEWYKKATERRYLPE